MLQFILLFIVLTPGILFTIPLYAKKGFGTKILTAILHGLVFVTAANFFILEGMNGEGFQGDARCGNLGRPSANGDLRIYTREECESLDFGDWQESGECYKGKGGEGGSYSYDCRYLNFPKANCERGSGGMHGEQSTSCTKCPPGRYSYEIVHNKTGYRVSHLCTTCPGNSITSEWGKAQCTPCGTNETANSSKTLCVLNLPTKCEWGSGGMEGDRSTSCTKCPRGRYSSEIVHNKPRYRVSHLCASCHDDSITPLEGQAVCNPCGPNEKANSSKTRCFSCPSNNIYQLAGEGTCRSCPGSSVPNSSRTACVPNFGTRR
jgi:hypothetical protein